MRNDILGDPIREILVLGVRAEVEEWQHPDRRRSSAAKRIYRGLRPCWCLTQLFHKRRHIHTRVWISGNQPTARAHPPMDISGLLLSFGEREQRTYIGVIDF